jgi:hypothetical protein
MYVNGKIMKGSLIFMILLEISTYPVVFFVLEDFIIFSDFISRGILPMNFCGRSSKTVS